MLAQWQNKDSLSRILRAATLQDFHWHTEVDCIVVSTQTRCWALMYGTVFVKGRQMEAKNVFFYPSSPSSQYKFRAPSFTCGSRDNVAWVIMVIVLLFHLGRLVECGDQPGEWGRCEAKIIYSAVFIRNFGMHENEGLCAGMSPCQYVLRLSRYDKYLF